MKAISFLLIAFALLASCGSKDPSPSVQNLLTDGDMEAPNGGDWTNQAYANAIYTWTTEESQSKSHSLKTEVDIDTASRYSVWNKYFATTPAMVGKDFTFTVSIKGKNLIGNGAAIAIDAYDVNNNYLENDYTQGRYSITGTFDWTTYRIKLQNLPAASSYIYIFLDFEPYTTGIVYFDNAVLTSN